LVFKIEPLRPARHVSSNNGQPRRDLFALLVRVKSTLDVSDGKAANRYSLRQFSKSTAISALGRGQVLLHAPPKENLLFFETASRADYLLIGVESVHSCIYSQQFLPERVGLALKALSRSASCRQGHIHRLELRLKLISLMSQFVNSRIGVVEMRSTDRAVLVA